MENLLKELREHERDYQELIHGPLCGQAANIIDRLTAERDRLIDERDVVRLDIDELIAERDGLKKALESLLTDPPADLDEPDEDWRVIVKMREIARAALATFTVPDADRQGGGNG